MCDFCEGNTKIETTIGLKEIIIGLEEENKNILKLRLPLQGGGGFTRPIYIKYCPFCGEDLKELTCKDCANYNIGDGVQDISECKNCICR